MWVSSHTGIACNEKADKYIDLATEYILNPKIKIIFTNDIKNCIKKILLIQQNHWNAVPTPNKLEYIKKNLKMADTFLSQPKTRHNNLSYQNWTHILKSLLLNKQRSSTNM